MKKRYLGESMGRGGRLKGEGHAKLSKNRRQATKYEFGKKGKRGRGSSEKRKIPPRGRGGDLPEGDGQKMERGKKERKKNMNEGRGERYR